MTVDESSREKVKTNNKQQQKEQDEEEDITTTDCLIDRLLFAKRLEKSAEDKRLIARLPSKTNSPHTRESLAHHHHSRHTPYTPARQRTMTSSAAVRQTYRQCVHWIRQLPASQQSPYWSELRTGFRTRLSSAATTSSSSGSHGPAVDDRLQQARDRLAFLRMTMPRTKTRGETHEGGRWIYKDGKRLACEEGGTLRDANGRVVSNWSGKNMDPDSVKRHKQSLNRAGFVNNGHAKGVF